MLGRTLRDGEPTLEETAKAMGLSPRALTRQLREEGSSFREILQSVRAMLARRYLLQRSLSDEDVSLLLGFEDPKAFRREFERWSGSSG